MLVKWSDNDLLFGPFVFARDGLYALGFAMRSASDEGDQPYGRIHLMGRTMLWPMPRWLIRPHRERVEAKYWDAATIERMGRNWYWNVTVREFGFTISEGHFNLSFGAQTHDSSTEMRWGMFLPWTQWRLVRDDIYDADGALFASLHGKDWQVSFPLKDACPRRSFAFRDYDGEEITATCMIEEAEHKFGTGYFKWLSLFRASKVNRGLDIRFSAEVGPRKGSWKGGTIGHSITMLAGETHEQAFRRYCDKEGLTFVSALPVTS